MATVVSHAMRRIATSPDANYSSCGLRSEKSRISWSQESESALSRSMRYADPWLYDSVRAPNGLLLAPALVLCSCQDYLNGTKRSSKKGPTTCKKCKGTRIPLSNGESKFGTMRCFPTTALAQTPTRAGTVRVTSTSRPSILPTADPYDLMRRSRLTVTENGSQFRARSVSPNKARPNESRSASATRQKPITKYSTVGRKSILECHVNPYELMSSDGGPQDASITRLNGQRIRVRPANLDPEYEDVQVRKPPSPYSKTHSQIPKPQNTISRIKLKHRPSSSSQKSNEKESESNRFKSILKKPTTTFSDTDSSYGPERSPSPAHRSGSHFYLPMPASTPRKKVQFLVENELVSLDQNNASHENTSEERHEITPEAGGEDQDVNDDTGISKYCKLKRSESDRALKEYSNKVVFHDSMALRSHNYRTDTRIIFTDKDLERLDGIYTSRFGKTRPKDPPPQPPASKSDPVETKERSEKKLVFHNPKVQVDDAKRSDPPPSAPPRKRSNNKQPTITANASPPDTPETIIEPDFFAHSYEAVSPNHSDEYSNDVTETHSYEDIPMLIASLPHINNIQEDHNIIDVTMEHSSAYSHDNYISTPEKILINCFDDSYSVEPYESIKIKDQSDNKLSVRKDYQDVQVDANKTILQICATDSTVHKLKIRNEFPETNNINTISVSDNTLGKTSIMINGDDCYSTIKVCDEIPLYHSSVVVKDTGNIETNRKSSTVYITGNFVNTFISTDDSPQNDDHSPKAAETKPEQTVHINTKDIVMHDEVVLREKNMSNLDLLKCLSDPVEAVRRNLVPHVCGKSDTPRRPKRGEPRMETLPQIQTLSEQDKVAKFIEESFIKLRNNNILDLDDKDLSSEHSSSTQYEIMDQVSDCYTDHSNRSSITEEELNARTKFYELLADSAIVEVSESEDHHYESIKINPDPIYEEIEIPPPLPSVPPPSNLLDDLQLDKEYTTRSIFEGASKYDILSYLVDAKERGIIPEDSYTYNFNNSDVVIEEEPKDTNELPYNRVSHMSTVSDSSEDSSLVMSCSMSDDKAQRTIEVERNDSGVGSETSKSSLSKYRAKSDVINTSCEDCESSLDSQIENEPLICRKCVKRRTERKEIITEIVETEEKYSRDLQIILEEFYQPMLVAGLLTSDQLSAIFLNVEELLENSQALAERLRDAVEIAIEQGDEDLLTVNIGKLILEAAPMLHAFETYCVRQGSASLLLASLEKEKELLRIFLRVSQMENTVLRRMNLNSFLMVPVQRVTKYPLLLARLYKVTPAHHDTREQLKESQHKIELHLNHMNSETKDVPSKLWRRISSIPGRRSSSEMDLVNIKLRKIAVDVLEWNHDEAKFALEGRLLFTQPTDNNWRKGRTIKLTPVNALLVTNGKSTSATRTDPADESLVFSRQAGIRDAALLLVRDKNGRYSLLREPLYLDRCVIAADPAWQSYFEVQELLGKDTFIFKAEDEDQTKIWYRQLQYYAQGMGAWRKRRNALANIMINGMGLRS